MSVSKESDLKEFYRLMSLLERLPNQGLPLSALTGKLQMPSRGVYFFREPGEIWSSGVPRVVRVGTHAVSAGSKSTLHSRLKAHLGSKSGMGNHRGSIFRLHVGNALLSKANQNIATWGKGSVAPLELKASSEVQAIEASLEKKVSAHIGEMSVLWVDVPDEPSSTSVRAFIERNAIALLSNRHSRSDAGDDTWLGSFSPRQEIRSSRLWNLKHIDETYDNSFLTYLGEAIEKTS